MLNMLELPVSRTDGESSWYSKLIIDVNANINVVRVGLYRRFL